MDICILPSFVLSILDFLILILWIAIWFVHLIAIFNAKFIVFHAAASEYEHLTEFSPPISIIKPLKGVDQNLEKNLESFFELNYPTFELLFGVQEADDGAVKVVKDLMKNYSNIDAQIFIGGAQSLGMNPKICNMQPAYLASKYEFIMFSDANVQVEENTLQEMVRCMDSKVALVHQLPFVTEQVGFSATLERIYFGTAHARAYLSANFLDIICVNGMSMLIRKSALDQIGGIGEFEKYLAEDFFLAKSLVDKGWKLAISSRPVYQNRATQNVGIFCQRIVRWTKLRISMLPLTLIVLEPLAECFPLGTIATWTIKNQFQFDPVIVFLSHTTLWFSLDFILLSIIQQKFSLKLIDIFSFVIAWIFREFSMLFLYLFALCTWKRVAWCDQQYRLVRGGLVNKVAGLEKV